MKEELNVVISLWWLVALVSAGLFGLTFSSKLHNYKMEINIIS